MDRRSHIEHNARMGQTSEQLAERNALRRMVFYGVICGVAGAIGANLILPSMTQWAAVLGVLIGVGVAIAIGEKIKRNHQSSLSHHSSEMAEEKEREKQAMIEAAKANGDFDRWAKPK